MADSKLAIVISAKDQSREALASVSESVKKLEGAATGPAKAFDSLGGMVGKVLGGFGAIGLASMGIETLSGVANGLIHDSVEAEKVQGQLNSVLTSTHGIAGMTADSVNELADSLGKVTPFSERAVVGAENLLLTFTGIGKDIFPQATESVLNMSQALGQDLQSSSIQLGKALNDPIKGITALSRVGVSFTEAQKEQIKALVKAGDTMGAQKVILKELSTEFGNSAKAAGETFSGKLAILDHSLEKIKEAVGVPLLDALSALMTAIMPAITAFGDWFPKALETAEDVVKGFISTVMGPIKEFLGYLSPDNKTDVMRAWFGPDFGPKIDQVVRSVELLVRDVSMGAGAIQAAFKDLLSGNFDAIRMDIDELQANIRGDLEELVGNAKVLGQQFVTTFLNWIEPLVAQIPGKLAAVGASVMGWVTGEIPILVNQFNDWKAAFFDWVEPLIAQVPDRLGAIADSVRTWIAGEVPIIVARLNEWKDAFLAWALPIAAQVGSKLNAIGSGIVTWVKNEVPIILAQLDAWKTAFLGWAVPIAAQIPGKLTEIATNVKAWIANEAAILPVQLATWQKAFTGWIDPLPDSCTSRLTRLPTALIDWLSKQVQPLIDGFQPWAEAFVAWIVPATTDFLAHWPAMLNSFLDWIGTAAVPILEQLGKWGLAFIAWIAPRLPGILLALAGIALAITVFIVETVAVLALKLGQWALAFVGWVVPMIPKLIVELGKIVASIDGWLRNAAISLAKSALALGVSIIQGIIQGIKSITIDPTSLLPGIKLPGFAMGGIVGGSMGAPSLAVVHGGERITPPGQAIGSNSTINVHIYGSGGDPTQIRQQAHQGVLEAQRALGFR